MKVGSLFFYFVWCDDVAGYHMAERVEALLQDTQHVISGTRYVCRPIARTIGASFLQRPVDPGRLLKGSWYIFFLLEGVVCLELL